MYINETEMKKTTDRIYQDLQSFVNSNELTEIEIPNNYEFISAGAAKEVYDLNNGYVAKVAPKYIRDIHNEIDIYSRSNENLKSFLLPILMSKTEERVAFQHKVNPVKFRDIAAFLMEKLGMERTNLIMNGIYQLSEDFKLVYSDLKLSQNWGELNGNYYLIDYGMKIDDEYDCEEDDM